MSGKAVPVVSVAVAVLILLWLRSGSDDVVADTAILDDSRTQQAGLKGRADRLHLPDLKQRPDICLAKEERGVEQRDHSRIFQSSDDDSMHQSDEQHAHDQEGEWITFTLSLSNLLMTVFVTIGVVLLALHWNEKHRTELTGVAEETEVLVNGVDSTAHAHHHSLSQAKTTHQELANTKLKTVQTPCNHSQRAESNVSTATKKTKLKPRSEVLTSKTTTSLLPRLLVIARSCDNVDLQDIVGMHEFSDTNRVLMQPDGSVHPTYDKSKIIKFLEQLVETDNDAVQSYTNITVEEKSHTCLVVDAMAVVQELMAVKDFSNCKAFGTAYVRLIDFKAQGYAQVRVIFDNYTKLSSLKEGTRERRRGKAQSVKSYIAEDSTCIKDKKEFLSSNETLDSLTLYLAQKLIDTSLTLNMVTATRMSVMTNSGCHIATDVSSQEEADTLMILHSVDAALSGYSVHIYSQDTDVLLLALRRVPQLGNKCALIMGTSKYRRRVKLKPIYDKLGPKKASALINWHALTGCDTTGHIQRKGKKGCFDAFMNASSFVLTAIAGLGLGDEPSPEVLSGCEEFLCTLFCPKGVKIKQAAHLRWHIFKQQKTNNMDKLPPTLGAWTEHIRRAHVQASIWHQDLVLHPVFPDPLKLGWQQENGRFLPVLSQVVPVPESVLQLVRCKCDANNVESKHPCSGRCPCRSNGLICIKLCKCEADYESCTNRIADET